MSTRNRSAKDKARARAKRAADARLERGRAAEIEAWVAARLAQIAEWRADWEANMPPVPAERALEVADVHAWAGEVGQWAGADADAFLMRHGSIPHEMPIDKIAELWRAGGRRAWWTEPGVTVVDIELADPENGPQGEVRLVFSDEV